jgi:hypothetical protein
LLTKTGTFIPSPMFDALSQMRSLTLCRSSGQGGRTWFFSSQPQRVDVPSFVGEWLSRAGLIEVTDPDGPEAGGHEFRMTRAGRELVEP